MGRTSPVTYANTTGGTFGQPLAEFSNGAVLFVGYSGVRKTIEALCTDAGIELLPDDVHSYQKMPFDMIYGMEYRHRVEIPITSDRNRAIVQLMGVPHDIIDLLLRGKK